MQKQKLSGFTIVELLIVIVVIGILAALVLNSFAGAQDKARLSKVQNDIAVLEKAVLSARIQSDKPLYYITNHGCTNCECKYGQTPTDALPYWQLPKNHVCWMRYYETLDKIAAASGTNLDQLKAGDPWGSPYLIDENEATNSDPCFYGDTLQSAGKSGRIDGNTRVGSVLVPFYLPECI